VIYLLQMSCGDYYCDGQHPAGAYSTRERAELALAAAVELQTEWDSQLYQSGWIVEIEVDAPPVER
jgi:hypothetical protein